MVELIAVGIGGAIGAILRYATTTWVQRLVGASFPTGTLVVNLLGCFLLGALVALVVERDVLSPHARLLVLVGGLGSFTTFATFGQETLTLLQQGRAAAAFTYAGASVLLGLGAVWLGRAGAKLLVGPELG